MYFTINDANMQSFSRIHSAFGGLIDIFGFMKAHETTCDPERQDEMSEVLVLSGSQTSRVIARGPSRLCSFHGWRMLRPLERARAPGALDRANNSRYNPNKHKRVALKGDLTGLIFMLSKHMQPQFSFYYWFSPPA
jgi:hypothetical protein